MCFFSKIILAPKTQVQEPGYGHCAGSTRLDWPHCKNPAETGEGEDRKREEAKEKSIERNVYRENKNRDVCMCIDKEIDG